MYLVRGIVAPDSAFDTVIDFEATGLAQDASGHITLRYIRPQDVSVEDAAEGADSHVPGALPVRASCSTRRDVWA